MSNADFAKNCRNSFHKVQDNAYKLNDFKIRINMIEETRKPGGFRREGGGAKT